MNWSARVDGDLEHQMRGWRRHLHAHPEIGFEEHETTKYIVHLLNGWDIACERPLATGVVVRVPAGLLGLRARLGGTLLGSGSALLGLGN